MTTTDRARLAIPLLQAIVEGKTLQYLRDGEEDDPFIDDPPEKQDDSTLRGIVENPQNWRVARRQWWLAAKCPDPASFYQFSSKAEMDEFLEQNEQFKAFNVHVIEAP